VGVDFESGWGWGIDPPPRSLRACLGMGQRADFWFQIRRLYHGSIEEVDMQAK